MKRKAHAKKRQTFRNRQEMKWLFLKFYYGECEFASLKRIVLHINNCVGWDIKRIEFVNVIIMLIESIDIKNKIRTSDSKWKLRKK